MYAIRSYYASELEIVINSEKSRLATVSAEAQAKFLADQEKRTKEFALDQKEHQERNTALLSEYIQDHPTFIQPVSRTNEMLQNFLLPGLEDLCVSRTSFKWGIAVDFDDKHRITSYNVCYTKLLRKRGVLGQVQVLRDQRRDDDPERLRQDHQPHGARGPQAERVGCLGLPP